MAQNGRAEAQAELKSSADKIFGFYKNDLKLLVQLFPQTTKSIEIEGGDQIRSGTVISWKFVLGVPTTIKSKVVEVIDEKNKSMIFDTFEGDMLKTYNSMKSKLEVVENGNGCCIVKWTVDFEKAYEDAPNLDGFANFGVEIAQGIDAYLSKN